MIKLFSCIECKAILFAASEIDFILIEDRLCQNVSVSINRSVRHRETCSIHEATSDYEPIDLMNIEM